jgi:hypothetical protein
MAAAEITPTYAPMQGSTPIIGRFTKVTQADWIVVPYPGIAGLEARLAIGTPETIAATVWGTAVVNNKGTAYTATTTSIVVDAGVITRQTPYYVQTAVGGELMLVVSETAVGNAASTLTVIRGCLGTTAAAANVADDVTLYIRNMVVFGSATTGIIEFHFFPLPLEPKAQLFD